MNKFFVDPVAALDGLLVDGMTILSYGLGHAAGPRDLVSRILEAGIRDITLVTDDERIEGFATRRLLDEGRVRRVIAPTPANPLIKDYYQARRIALELEAPAVLAERLAAGRLGFASFLTRTGVGSAAAEGRPLETAGGETVLRQAAVTADLAIIAARCADTAGNLSLHDASCVGVALATAARASVVQVDMMMEGRLDAAQTHVRGLHIDRLVLSARSSAASRSPLTEIFAAA